MRLNWMDVTPLSFNTLLLLERLQLSWLPGWTTCPRPELALALNHHPVVEWYLRHQCPEINPFLDEVMALSLPPNASPARVRQAEVTVLESLMDLVVYAVDPAQYDAQSFLGWNDQELLCLADFQCKTVIDIGSGTGRLAFAVAPLAKTVFAVEPVSNLRRVIREKAKARGIHNVYAVDGTITQVPFPEGFADVTMEGHVYGDEPLAEKVEMERVTRHGGMVIHMPGHIDRDDEVHRYLMAEGYSWARFEEPGDGWKRKYWKKIP